MNIEFIKNIYTKGAKNMANENRAKIMPNTKEVPFTITTPQVETYLQDKFAVVAKGMGVEAPEVAVVTLDAGRRFKPFLIAISTNILENYENDNSNNKRNERELDMFHPQENSRETVRLKDPYHKLLRLYTYDKEDGHTFDKNLWRNPMGVKPDAVGILKSLRVPSVSRYANGSIERVTALIDPVRVFHDMLTVESDRRNFFIDIKETSEIRTGEWKYEVLRSVHGSKKGGSDSTTEIAIELNRKLRSRR
jgi:hypothetical protein